MRHTTEATQVPNCRRKDCDDGRPVDAQSESRVKPLTFGVCFAGNSSSPSLHSGPGSGVRRRSPAACCYFKIYRHHITQVLDLKEHFSFFLPYSSVAPTLFLKKKTDFYSITASQLFFPYVFPVFCVYLLNFLYNRHYKINIYYVYYYYITH